MSLSTHSSHTAGVTPRPLVVSHAGLQLGVLWAFVFSGSIVQVEPSPYEGMFVLVAFVFLLTGLSFHRLLAPLVLTLAALNVGGLLSVAPYLDETKSFIFVLISIYMGLTCIFFACAMLDDAERRLAAIRSGYVWTAAFAGLLGIVGYFDQGALREILTRNDRADALFKDPNVYGPFLVLPLVWLADDLVRGAWKGPSRRVTLGAVWSTFTPFVLVLAGMFLSFSRGAWGVVVAAVVMTLGLRFLVDSTPAQRTRIVFMSLVGAALLAVLLVVALSIPEIKILFEQRASLNQDYDGGALGRFGGQQRSIPLLLDSPNGFGPLRFPIVVGNEDPHNVFINAFAAYGWIGGISYFAFIATTLYVGWRLVLREGPYRSAAIPIWSSAFFTILQGLQIDTDHWRHFYLLVGLTWGLAAATALHERRVSAIRRRTV